MPETFILCQRRSSAKSPKRMAEPERRSGKDERRWQGSPDANPPQTQIRTEQPHPSPPHKPHRNHDKGQRSQRSSEGEQSMPEIIVAGKYRLLSRIGNGSFGELYRIINYPRITFSLQLSIIWLLFLRHKLTG